MKNLIWKDKSRIENSELLDLFSYGVALIGKETRKALDIWMTKVKLKQLIYISI